MKRPRVSFSDDAPENDTRGRFTQFITSSDDVGRRLDLFLTSRLPELSRSQIQRLIRDGQVLVNARRVRSSLAVEPGLTVDVDLPAPVVSSATPEALPLTILHDDTDLVVIDKPAGMVVHPAAGHTRGTLVNALLHHVSGLSGIGGVDRPGIVHRLDRGTSGVMVIAKHDRAHRALSRQFHDREVEKEYLALVWGTVPAGLRVEDSIGRHRHHRQKMSSRTSRPRTALTQILDVEPLQGVSLVRVRIGTGRTHQIRVHLSERGHPVIGDALYGGTRRKVPAALAPVSRLDRPFLHAARLTFTHPGSGQRVTFEAPLPADLAALLATLRKTAREEIRN
jgi:23S rRNA pseudouridine1911/1915/1917 synthase